MNSALDVWLMRFTNNYQQNVARELASMPGINVVLATGHSDNKSFFNSHSEFSNTTFVNNGWLLSRPIQETSLWNPPKIFNLDNFHYLAAIQILDRNETAEGEIRTSERLSLILDQYFYWKKLLERNRPDAVVFIDTPHMYYELVLLGVLRDKGVPAILVENVAGEFHTFTDVNFEKLEISGSQDGAVLLRDRIHTAKDGHKTSVDSQMENLTEFQATFSAFLRVLARMILLGVKDYRFGHYISARHRKSRKRNSVFRESIQELRFLFSLATCKFYYRRISKKPSEFEGAKFVYFPLASGFENTMHPTIFPLSLEDCLKIASELMPDDHVLLVKEHPMQFRFRNHQRFARSINWYRRLGKIPRLVFVSDTASPFQLMRDSSFITCLSSSSSLIEGLALGKSVLSIGRQLTVDSPEKIHFIESLDKAKLSKLHEGSIYQGAPEEEKRLALSISHALEQICSNI